MSLCVYTLSVAMCVCDPWRETGLNAFPQCRSSAFYNESIDNYQYFISDLIFFSTFASYASFARNVQSTHILECAFHILALSCYHGTMQGQAIAKREITLLNQQLSTCQRSSMKVKSKTKILYNLYFKLEIVSRPCNSFTVKEEKQYIEM